MKICLISVHGDPLARLGGKQAGGQNVYVRNLAVELSRSNHMVSVLTRYEGTGPREQSFGSGARVVRLEAGPATFVDKGQLPAVLDRFRELVLEHWAEWGQPDIVHSNYWLSGSVALGLKAAAGVPLVHSYHSLGVAKMRASRQRGVDRPRRRLLVEAELGSTADVVIACTRYEESILRDAYAAKSRISVVPAGVDNTIFRPRDRDEARRRTGMNGPTVLFVGRPVAAKGLPVLIEAFALLRRDGIDARLLAVGGRERRLDDIHRRGRLEHMIRRLGIEDRVTLVGAKPQRELPWYFSGADLTVVPSWYENFGLVALEAQACGSPVVASKVGGLQHIVRPGKTGHLVSPRDPRQLAAAIAMLISDHRQRERMGRNAERMVRREYGWGQISAQISRIYEQTVRSAGVGRVQPSH